MILKYFQICHLICSLTFYFYFFHIFLSPFSIFGFGENKVKGKECVHKIT